MCSVSTPAGEHRALGAVATEVPLGPVWILEARSSRRPLASTKLRTAVGRGRSSVFGIVATLG